jgi:hypothetical protein
LDEVLLAPEYPATMPIIEILQPQVKTPINPRRKTATRTVIPACSELIIWLIHSSMMFVIEDNKLGYSLLHTFVALQANRKPSFRPVRNFYSQHSGNSLISQLQPFLM